MLVSTITDSQHGPGLFVVTQPQINQILKTDSETPFGKELSIFPYRFMREHKSQHHFQTDWSLSLLQSQLMHTLPATNLNILAARSGCILETSNVPHGIYKTFTAL